MSSEFVVSARKRCDIEGRLARIQDALCVQVRLGDGEGCTSDSGVVVGCDLESDAETVWVQVEGEDRDRCHKAKEYILSVCSENRVIESFPPPTLDMLDTRIPRFELESGAVIERLPGDRLCFQGTDENIVRAQSLISMETSSSSPPPFRDSSQSTLYSPDNRISQNGAISRLTASSRTDMSDSIPSRNFDEMDGRTKSVSKVQNGVKPQPRELVAKATPSSASSSTSNSTSNSTSKSTAGKGDEMALMLKLGYSRQQVDLAFERLGPTASSNEILQVLVSQGSSRADPEEGVQRGDEGAVASPRVDISDGIDDASDKEELDPYRPIIIDGSNVAMSYGRKNVFGCKGIDIVVMWFLNKGHKVIYVFVPSWRKEQSKPETPIQDQEILLELEKAKILIWTPSRRVKGRRVVCYDDRYILNLAKELDGIVVSNDTFRDLAAEKPEYRKVVEERLLMYSFVGDKFMPPDDPLGRHGPSLDNFLRKTPIKPAHQMQPCPYGKKCTYGNKCKYSHPERSKHRKPTSELLVEQDQRRKEHRVWQELQTRKLGASNHVMPWDRADGGGGVVGGGDTEPLGSSMPMTRGARSSPVSHQESAGTWPLMSNNLSENSMSTVPLSSTQRAQLVHRHGGEELMGGGAYRGMQVPREIGGTQNMHQVGERWVPSVPDRRVVGYHPQRVATGRQSMPHNVLPQQQNPSRSSMTAPLTGYAPAIQPPARDMMTTPLTDRDFQNQAAHQMGVVGGQQRYYHPPPAAPRESQLPSSSGQYHHSRDPHTRDPHTRDPLPREPLPREHRDPREPVMMTNFRQEFQSLGLHESSRGNAFEEERHNSYPLAGPYRSPNMARQNGEFTPQTSTNPGDDEGYFSPRLDPSAPSQGLNHPHHHHSTGNIHTPSDNMHAQSHSYAFRYPASSASTAPSGWGQQQQQQQQQQPPVGGASSIQPGLDHRSSPTRGYAGAGVTHSLEGRRMSEPFHARHNWGDRTPNPLQDPLRLPSGGSDPLEPWK